jgi:hypothetical protein
MRNDDAVETLHGLISKARRLNKEKKECLTICRKTI